ncbi:MAG: hypothetical protein H7174_06045 [Flavobacterium sp.]|nr:hypothetical protein [Flavobacterium sp.]
MIASFLFLIGFVKRKRPSVNISNYICKTEHEGKINYLFKFVNKTDVEIFDVHLEPTFYKPSSDLMVKTLLVHI